MGRVLRHFLFGVCVMVGLSVAGTKETASAQTIRSLALAVDNDGFVFWIPRHRRPDRYYTNGLRIEGEFAWAPPWVGLLGSDELSACGGEPSDEPCFLTRVTIGQEIYTPNYLFDLDPSSHDRPYAGWLFTDVSTRKLGMGESTSLSLQIGVTGGPSLASQVHRWFHRSLEKHEPIGWEHQIPFAPAFLIRYETRRAFSVRSDSGNPFLTLEPRVSAAFGTVRTGATAGIFVSGGWNRPPYRDSRPAGDRPLSFGFVFGVESEYVLRDLFLDGNAGDWSSPASREPWVARLRGGFQGSWNRFKLEFRVTRSTLEFRGQEGEHTYGTFRLIVLS